MEDDILVFYSQGYDMIYNQGQKLDVSTLQKSEPYSYHFHGLSLDGEEILGNAEEILESSTFLDEFVYRLRFSFHLDDINQYNKFDLADVMLVDDLPGCMIADTYEGDRTNIELPERIWESYFFYRSTLKDRGVIFGFRITIEGQDTLVIRAVSDSMCGAIEIFDPLGNVLGAARTAIIGDNRIISWSPREQIRQYDFDDHEYPPEMLQS